MKNVLVVYAHPSPNRSRINKHMLSCAKALRNVETRDLYELYPNFHIDVAAEQDALRQADIVVFQFPIFLFSSPAILKEWQDTVLTSEFAYSHGERALTDKYFMLAVSTGGSSASYTQLGRHGAGIGTYLAPLEQTARFCGMTLMEPFIVQCAGDVTESTLQVIGEDYSNRLTELGNHRYGN